MTDAKSTTPTKSPAKPGPETNYKVAVARYGKYEYGQIIPAAVPIAYGADPAELVANGTLVPTTEPGNCPLVPIDAAPQLDGTAELVADRNEWRQRARTAEAELLIARAQVEGLEKENARFQTGLGKLAAEKAVLEGRIAELTQDLDERTAPQADAAPAAETEPAPPLTAAA